MIYPGGFCPGDPVTVVDGTFLGAPGTVLSPDEAIALRETHGGQETILKAPRGLVWVAIQFLGRTFPVLLEPFQIRRSDLS